MIETVALSQEGGGIKDREEIKINGGAEGAVMMSIEFLYQRLGMCEHGRRKNPLVL